MKRSFQFSNASPDYWEENEEESSRIYSHISGGGSDYDQRMSEARNRLSMKTSRVRNLPHLSLYIAQKLSV